ncbi:alpha-2,8-polysialyltransferase family protein [Aliarcobacter butzleri]|uniref:alpha-2,8-polysialyltransferase family protein n=1 Tax=Aliarcobacter butzleri TaxID=28197 RepID=UPI0021B67C00|nr:alpha-2,8-polysialyltransferase family protein [Aliarcobacter butzleri]MCT7650596.1 alpha-2,8-polysialyltransferase family protein [Aliarcobacter butzleri]
MKKNLIIIGSPLQLINAMEAVHFFKLENVILVIAFNGLLSNNIQIEEQINSFKCEEVVKIYPSSVSKFLQYLKLIKYLQRYKYEKLFIGEFGSAFRIILANINKEKVFLLDDGTATIVDYEKSIKINKINRYSFKELRFLIFGLKIRVKDKINFFTYYNLEKLPDSEVIKNNLEYMKKDFIQNSIDYDDTIFFFGQPSEIFLDKQELELNLYKIVNKFSEKKILYIPHRAQTKDEINNIRLMNKNIKILEINKPVEKYFLNNGIYPKHVISYVSTALTTTKILFPECNANYIKIKNPNFDLIDMKYLDYLYYYFEEDNINKLTI